MHERSLQPSTPTDPPSFHTKTPEIAALRLKLSDGTSHPRLRMQEAVTKREDELLILRIEEGVAQATRSSRKFWRL